MASGVLQRVSGVSRGVPEGLRGISGKFKGYQGLSGAFKVDPRRFQVYEKVPGAFKIVS